MWVDAQGAGNFHAPPLSPGQSIPAILADMLQSQLINQFFHFLPALVPGDGWASSTARMFSSTVSLRNTEAS